LCTFPSPEWKMPNPDPGVWEQRDPSSPAHLKAASCVPLRPCLWLACSRSYLLLYTAVTL